jgi:hypothetical protein
VLEGIVDRAGIWSCGEVGQMRIVSMIRALLENASVFFVPAGAFEKMILAELGSVVDGL